MLVARPERSQCLRIVRAADFARPDRGNRDITRSYTVAMRLAWFTPWPPDPSGVAGRSAELVTALAARGHGIDVFVDERRVAVTRGRAGAPAPGDVRVESAHDAVWRIARTQYDLIVYQAGNSRLHEFLWPYLFRYPGLVVFHDARLHHARARALLAHQAADTYRAEFAWSHPGVSPDAAELAVRGFDVAYYYQWPMVRAVAAASRMAAAHSRGAVAVLTEACPGMPVEYIALGEGIGPAVSIDERGETRAALGCGGAEVLFGVFGALTAEKRVPQILTAFASTVAQAPHARLLLAGTPDPSLDVADLVASLGIAHAVIAQRGLADRDFDRAIAAVDVALCLRWPSTLETSGPWLRALSAGRPTVTLDLPHQADLPALDPRTWQPYRSGADAAPVTVALDILDEAHSLRLALRRLSTDAPLRDRLGRAARDYWTREHTVDRMVADYERVMPLAAAARSPSVALPAGLRPDPFAHARTLLAETGSLSCELL